jgi:hypothetical protein
MMETIIEPIAVELPSGAKIHVESTDLGGSEEVAVRVPRLEEVIEPLRELSELLLQAVSELGTRRVTLEFGIGVAIESGQLVTLIAKGSAQANLKVTVELGS